MISVNSTPVDFKHFPDKSTLIKFLVTPDLKSVRIEWLWENNEEIFNLYLLVNHLHEYEVYDIILDVPYLPNARQDRVHTMEDVFTLKYFCKLINSMEFRGVVTRDVHSSVALALIDRVVDEPITDYVDCAMAMANLLHKDDTNVLFYPDEGAMKRYSSLITSPYIFGIKKRDWETGKIMGLDVAGEIPDAPFDVMFVDDIISYGGSLLHSAKKLKELGARNVYAFITHVENSILDGEVINSGLIETIFTSKSIFTGTHPLIKVVDRLC